MTVEHAATVTMQIAAADTYMTRYQRPTVAHCQDNVVLCRSYNGKLERRGEVDPLWDKQPVELTKKRRGDKCSLLLAEYMRRAAEFTTDCSQFSCHAGKPASVEQP